MSKLIYVIEDEENIRDLIKLTLVSYGYEVLAFSNAEDALANIERNIPAVACFDVMLPGMDGFSAVHIIRNNPKTKNLPVLFITAKDSEVDIIRGFESGADDYITKPFSVLELCARIKALIRRSSLANDDQSKLVIGDIELDQVTRDVYCKGELIELTYKEYELLLLLMKNYNQVLDRETLLNKVWGYGGSGDTRTIDVHIRHLREKLKGQSDYILTIRGVGYRFVIPK